MTTRNLYDPAMDRLKVPFPDVAYDDPQPLVEAIQSGSRKVWVISDTHLFHERLWTVLHPTVEGGRDPRNTELILTNWRQMVESEDLVLHLGDVALGISAADYQARIGYLSGEVWLLLGNHDRDEKKMVAFRKMGWKRILPFALELNGWQISFTHEPIPSQVLGAGELNAHGHIHHNPAYSQRHQNLCIEWLGYSPVELRPLLDRWVGGLPVPELSRLDTPQNRRGKKRIARARRRHQTELTEDLTPSIS